MDLSLIPSLILVIVYVIVLCIVSFIPTKDGTSEKLKELDMQIDISIQKTKKEVMNIYEINEDSTIFYIRANSMNEACEICETSYIEDRVEEEKDPSPEFVSSEIKYYRENLLLSCRLLGELAN